ncbi:MAG: hypothetical protein H5T73_00315 [Actinobacteria bacterium]|nr:hypothetical protein [Actinomycetota bacterium]
MMRRRERSETALEMKADAFLREIPQPRVPRALVHHGAQRAAAIASARQAATGRRVYRRPLPAHRAVLATLLAVVLLAGTTSATYAASMDAAPGSLLYGSKIFFERTRVFFTVSRAEDAKLEMEYSERRMRELSHMMAGASEPAAERWLREYRRNVEGAEALLDGLSGQEASLLAARLLETLEEQAAALESMPRFPATTPAMSSCLEEAYRICDGSRARMRRRCGEGCDHEGKPGLPGNGEDKGERGGGAAVDAPGDATSFSCQEQEAITTCTATYPGEGGVSRGGVTTEGEASGGGTHGQATTGARGDFRSGNHRED